MFGSLAFGIAAIFSGSLVDHASEDSVLFKYEIAFNLMAAFWIADIFILYLIRVSRTFTVCDIKMYILKVMLRSCIVTDTEYLLYSTELC